MNTSEFNNLPAIGSTEYVEIASVAKIPAKIDTGADSSSVWASDINMGEDGVLSFVLFGPKSPFYTGKAIKVKDYTVKSIRSSIGKKQIRYCVKLPLKIGKKKISATFSLANRARNRFPVLVGRRTLKGNFIVDVKKAEVPRPGALKSQKLSQELKNNPHQFHQKYMKKGTA